METLRIGQISIPLEAPHPLLLAGLLEAYDEPADRPMLRFAYLGACCKGPKKPPHRVKGEPHPQWGRRVYDHLMSLGFGHWDMMEAASAAMAEGIEAMPEPLTKTEIEDAGKPSTGVSSSSASGSPTDTPETPSDG